METTSYQYFITKIKIKIKFFELNFFPDMKKNENKEATSRAQNSNVATRLE